MFLDLHAGILEEFAERSALGMFDRDGGLPIMAWPKREPSVTEADFPRLEREARLILPRCGTADSLSRREARRAKQTEYRRAKGPQRVGDVSRAVARRADPAYREWERVWQADFIREKRKDPAFRAREAETARERRRRKRGIAASSGA